MFTLFIGILFNFSLMDGDVKETPKARLIYHQQVLTVLPYKTKERIKKLTIIDGNGEDIYKVRIKTKAPVFQVRIHTSRTGLHWMQLDDTFIPVIL